MSVIIELERKWRHTMNRINEFAKRSSFIILLIALIVGSSVSEAVIKKEKIVADQEIFGAYSNYKGEIGFFNYYGSMIKKPQFERLWKWDDQVILLRKAGRFGAIDYFGNTVVSFEYEFLDNPSDGTIVYGTYISFKGPKYYGLIDAKGKLIVEAQYDAVEKIDGGGIITTINYTEGTKYGVVFKNKVNVKPSYDGIFSSNEEFVITRNRIKGIDKYGFISSNGSRSEPIFDQATLSEDGHYVIAEQMINGQRFVQLFNNYGAVVGNKSFDYISPKGYTDNEGNVKDFTTVIKSGQTKNNKGFDLLTTSGELKNYILRSVDYTPIFSQYYKITDESNLIGLVDKYGNIIVKPRFSAIESYLDDYFVGVVNGARGVFNRKGEEIIGLSTYDHIDITEDHYFIAQIDKKINIFNEAGYLQFQFQGESVEGIGNNRFITKHQSPHASNDGTPKYYYNLVDEFGHEQLTKNQYCYMGVIGENRIVIGRDTDGRWEYPSGSIEYVRVPFADIFGVVDFEGEEILPVSYTNISDYSKGIIFTQRPEDPYIVAFDINGQQLNKDPIKSFDPFNRGVITIEPFRNIQKSGYLNNKGEFFQLVYEQLVDETTIKQELLIEDDFINVVETKTRIYSEEKIENLVNEEIIDGYFELKNRYGGEIYILKDKQWYIDTFSQQ